MGFPRPDLSNVDPEIRAYIEALESELERCQRVPSRPRRREEPAESFEDIPESFDPAEPPTPIQVITMTASGMAKRTPRHLYNRQRRGGMGVFDIDVPNNEPPSILTLADENQILLVITNQARVFRLPVNLIPETPVRARGESILGKLNLAPDEKLAVALPEQAQGYVALVSQKGNVRMLRHHFFGEHMRPGTSLYDIKMFGPLASACWTPGNGDLLVVTEQGRAIRFPEKSLPPQGGPGIRLSEGDIAVAITAVSQDSNVFMLGADGKGTIRSMENFIPNKAPGAGGKITFNTDQLTAACSVEEDDDIFIISRLSKIIRFRAGEVPVKDGVVQGVICMSLRGDDTFAMALNPAL